MAKRPVLGAIAGELADFFVITNEDPFGEDADAIIDQVAGGAPVGAEGTRLCASTTVATPFAWRWSAPDPATRS